MKTLYRQFSRFIKTHHVLVRFEPEPEPGYHAGYVATAPEIPESWSLILGDAIHNFRSALDHAFWALPRIGGQAPNPQAQFPICATAEGWCSKGTRADMEQLPLGLVVMLDRIQPYHRGRKHAPWMALSRLAKWDNLDKHRVLNLLRFAVVDVRLDPDPVAMGSATEIEVFRGIPLKVGHKLVRMKTTGSAKPEGDAQSEVVIEVAFADGVEVPDVMGLIKEAVNDILGLADTIILNAPHWRT